MALREVLADLDIKVRGGEKLDAATANIDRFVKSVSQKGPVQTYGREIDRLGTAASGAYGPTNQLALATGPSGLGGAVGALGAAFVAAGVADKLREIAGAAIATVAEIIEIGDAIGDTAARTGASTDEIQRWSYVAETMGVDASALEGSMRAFNRTVGNAVQGQSGAVRAFRALNVELQDGNGRFRSRGEIMRDAIAAIQRIEDPTRRAAVAQTVFGRGAESMGAILNATNEELDAASERFEELGGGLDEGVIAQAGEADNALRDFRLVMLQLKGTLVTSILPTVTQVISTLADFVSVGAELIRTSSIMEVSLGVLAGAMGLLVLATAPVTVPMLAIGAAIVILIALVEDVVSAFNGYDSVTSRVAESLLHLVGVNLTFKSSIELIGLAWSEMAVDAREALAVVLETAARTASALGVAIPDGLARAAVDARIGTEQARAGVTRDRAGLVQREMERQQARNDALAPPPPPGVASVRKRGGGGGGSVTQQISAPLTIHVDGSQDPEATSREVQRVVERHNRERIQQAARAVLPQAAEDD